MCVCVWVMHVCMHDKHTHKHTNTHKKRSADKEEEASYFNEKKKSSFHDSGHHSYLSMCFSFFV